MGKFRLKKDIEKNERRLARELGKALHTVRKLKDGSFVKKLIKQNKELREQAFPEKLENHYREIIDELGEQVDDLQSDLSHVRKRVLEYREMFQWLQDNGHGFFEVDNHDDVSFCVELSSGDGQSPFIKFNQRWCEGEDLDSAVRNAMAGEIYEDEVLRVG
jgi:hypothetical protein